MIQANELRIGNLFKLKDSVIQKSFTYSKVTTIYQDKAVFDNHYPQDWFEPIPLTEEILLKCGFKYLNGRTSGDLTFDILHYEFDYIDGVFVTKSRYEPFECREKLYNFKYLHQLQNLYFALTNKELDIDLSR